MRILPRRVVWVGLLLGASVALAACGDDSSPAADTTTTTTSAPADSSATAATTPSDIQIAHDLTFDDSVGQVRSRFVTDGYEGGAWPVPQNPLDGDHVNDVEVTLLDENGDPAGTAFVPAGTKVEIRAPDGTDLVEFDWSDGLTANAAREDFWIIGEFVDFRDIVLEIEGVATPIGESGLQYNRVTVSNFDDRDTPEFEGIANKIRQYLACTEDEWKIANQYFAADIVGDGIYENDPTLVERGVLSMNWGIAQTLETDGVFSLYRACDGLTARDFSETHHSTQWFAGLGRGVFLLASSPQAGEYRAEIDAYIDHLETLATYLTTPPVRDHWIERWLYEPNGDVFTHKFYMRAAGLGLASALTDNPDDAARWSAEARVFAEKGMAQQWPEGVNPERGGPDVRYQMYGTWLGIVYRSTLVDGDHRDALAATITRAIEWEDTRLGPDGVVEIAGSTRSCTDNSNVNEYHPYHMLSSYLLWAHLEPGNDHLFDRAILADAGHRTGGNRCPEPEPTDS